MVTYPLQIAQQNIASLSFIAKLLEVAARRQASQTPGA